jgi:hypothetical protein
MADHRMTRSSRDDTGGDDWHVPTGDLDAYLDDRLGEVTTASVEAHLLACDRCRRSLATRSASRPSDVRSGEASWTAIERRIDEDTSSRAQKALSAVGLAPHDARIIAPTRPSALAWLLATSAALACAAWLARAEIGATPSLARTGFLTIAPLAPLVAVVLALGTSALPVPEISAATPVSRLRIAALRAATALTVSIAVGVAISTVMPGAWTEGVAWLAPGLALSGLGALVANRAPATVAVTGLAALWVGLVGVAAAVSGDRLAAFRAAPQWWYLAVAVLCAVLIARRPSIMELEARQ